MIEYDPEPPFDAGDLGRRPRPPQLARVLPPPGLAGRRDGEEMPLAGHALELVSAAVFELEP